MKTPPFPKTGPAPAKPISGNGGTCGADFSIKGNCDVYSQTKSDEKILPDK